MNDVATEMAALDGMTTGELADRYAELHGQTFKFERVVVVARDPVGYVGVEVHRDVIDVNQVAHPVAHRKLQSNHHAGGVVEIDFIHEEFIIQPLGAEELQQADARTDIQRL